jgi:hypothetical protein
MIFAVSGVSAERGRAWADTAGKDMPAFCGGFETTAVGELGHGPSLFRLPCSPEKLPSQTTTDAVLQTIAPRASVPTDMSPCAQSTWFISVEIIHDRARPDMQPFLLEPRTKDRRGSCQNLNHPPRAVGTLIG